ncbi:MAG: Ig-like domain-containing protein [Spirochaetes bacterium]|nr:Ig-like domain-containing protein [Spirochaetota bacterium]
MRFLRILSILCLLLSLSCSQSNVWEELTKDPDVIPPVVSSVSPQDGQTGVAVSGMSIKVQFSEKMDPSSVNEDTFYLKDSSGQKIKCDVSDFSSSMLFMAVPSSALSLSSKYTVCISKDVCDTSGNKMINDYSFSFTTSATAPASDVTNPEITVKYKGAALADGKTIESSANITIEILEKNLKSKSITIQDVTAGKALSFTEKGSTILKDDLIAIIGTIPSNSDTKVHIFQLSFSAVDFSGNETKKNVTINVNPIDTTKPVITLKSGSKVLENETAIAPNDTITIEITDDNLSEPDTDYSTGNTVLQVGQFSVSKTQNSPNYKYVITPNASFNVGRNRTFCISAADVSGNVTIKSITLNVGSAVYVDSSLGNDGNPATSGSPVQTIAKALTLLNGKKNDECFIYLSSGTYSDSVSISGFTKGIMISGGWSDGFTTKGFTSKSTIEGAGSGISISSCSDVKLSGLEVVTNDSMPSPGSVYSNVTVDTTQNFEINCCDLQGIKTSGVDHADISAMKIDSAKMIKITNCKVRTNFQINKPYRVNGNYKGIEIVNCPTESNIYIFNNQVLMWVNPSANSLLDITDNITAEVSCLHVVGAATDSNFYIFCNSFDAGCAKTARCLYWDSPNFNCWIDNVIFNRQGRKDEFADIYSVITKNPTMNNKSDAFIMILGFASTINIGTLSNSSSTDSGFSIFSNYTNCDLIPQLWIDGYIKPGYAYDLFKTKSYYTDNFPKNSSGNYCDITGKDRPAGDGMKWSIGAYEMN